MKILHRNLAQKLSISAPAFATVLCLVGLYILVSPSQAVAQRDYFTNEEVDMIRDAQQIDMRMDLLIRIIDRRFAAAGIEAGGTKVPAKDDVKWGALFGTRGDMMFDIKRILQKAIDDIDNVASHPDALVYDPADPDHTQKKNFSSLFPKAVHKLAAAADRWKPVLNTTLTSATDQKERGSILDSIDMCSDISASLANLSSAPKPDKPTK
jgi:hypothetical protein